MFSRTKSAAIYGIESKMVSVEADVSDGLPQFLMVGYLASEVKEAQDRVRIAIKNSGYKLMPKKVTVNLAPADIRKAGAGFDLPIAVAVLSSYGYIPKDLVEGIFFAGELSLDGGICAVRGILGMVMEAKQGGCHTFIIPYDNLQEGAVIQGIRVLGANHLKEVVSFLCAGIPLKTMSINIEEKFSEDSLRKTPDFSDIKGQHIVKRAAEIAAAGMHNILISGPPGAGKTMIASRIAGILPLMTTEEALEVSKIHSVAGVLPEEGILYERPFRMPHHTISSAALAGGGAVPRPGEISLAHRGVLYLDELPEFQKETLEILRQPLEEGEIRISRNHAQCVFPADFMLVASRNPCKCGYYPDRRKCSCTEREVRQYLHRISRPLLDRIDIHVKAHPLGFEELTKTGTEETSKEIRSRVLNAQKRQLDRYKGTNFRFNSQLSSSSLETYCIFDEETKEKLHQIYEEKGLTARAFHKMIKVARTIADLDGSDTVQMAHLSEAVFYRPAEELQ